MYCIEQSRGRFVACSGILWYMSTKPQTSIDAEQAKKLAVELSGLLRQQLEALEDSAYILMDEEKVEAYEQRSKRIAELKVFFFQQKTAYDMSSLKINESSGEGLSSGWFTR